MRVDRNRLDGPQELRTGTVTAVSRNGSHAFSKPNRNEIVLVAGVGVEGDAHAGVTVRHRSRVAADPTQPNMRQVHLIHRELFDEVGAKGYAVASGQLGENITTGGLDLLGLPCGTVLRFGPPPPADAVAEQERAAGGSAREAVAEVVAAAGRATLDAATADAVAALVAAAERERTRGDHRPAVVVTGLRNPCRQINGIGDGLMKEVARRGDDGTLVRKAGVMGVVLVGGRVAPGDPITAELPPPPHRPLDPV